MSNWAEMTDNEIQGSEYTNAERGWRNAATDAEVIVYGVEGTGMEEVTDKMWAVQHPLDQDDEHTYFFDTVDEATRYAEDYIETHPTPAAQF